MNDNLIVKIVIFGHIAATEENIKPPTNNIAVLIAHKRPQTSGFKVSYELCANS